MQSCANNALLLIELLDQKALILVVSEENDTDKLAAQTVLKNSIHACLLPPPPTPENKRSMPSHVATIYFNNFLFVISLGRRNLLKVRSPGSERLTLADEDHLHSGLSQTDCGCEGILWT